MRNQKLTNVVEKSGLLAGASLLVILGGCITAGGGHARYEGAPVQTAVVVDDDYDYYPAYEVYYSSSRHEYVYRDVNNWVHRNEYRNVTPEALHAAPSVRVNFHDAPENHHATVVKQYPKTWKQPDRAQADKDDRKESEKRN